MHQRPSLAHLMEQCQSLKIITLEISLMKITAVLGDYSRPGLGHRIRTAANLRAWNSALAEILGRNEGPTKLHDCEIDHFPFCGR
jgi:hypothetical protein